MIQNSNQLQDKMRRETERFLSRAMRTIRQPRQTYEQFVTELKLSRKAESKTARVPQLSAA